ncbi:MAG: AMP-binding protein, partial [Clostridia bacterium]|nr:AMP-binding protein [Clostridia bacterium]
VLMESHGRQPLFEGDISRTVGWFTSYYPVVFSGKGSAEECVTENKERLLSVPLGGVRYQFTEKKNAPDIIFNYMGEYDLGNSPMKLCSLPVPDSNPEKEALDVEGEINDGVLTFSLRFNGPSKETGERLKESFRQELIRICELCTDEKEKILSPTDLGCPGMDKDDFAEVMKVGPVCIAPLTPTQQGMLFHSEDDKEEYLEQSAVRLPFTPDINKAERLLNALAGKYAIFRTVYVLCESGNIYQCVLGSSKIKLNVADDLSAVRDRRVKEGVSPFDGVPIRLDIIGDVLLITSHHLLLDAWSEGVFIDEFEKLYIEDRLPKERESFSFCAYASELAYGWYARDYDYWKNLIEGATSSLVPGHAAGVREENRRTIKEISSSEKILSFARKNGVTENSVFEAAAARFMQIVCGKTDVIFGKVVSGRDSKTVNAVGLYISTVPVRVRSENAQDVLFEIDRQTRALSEYAVCPLNEIFKRARLQDPIGMLFVYDSIESTAKTKPLFVRDSTNYGITLAVSKDDKFIADISYNDGEYLPEEIDALLSLYVECVDEITEGKAPAYKPLSGEKASYPLTLTEIWKSHPDFTLIADKEYSAAEISRRAEILSGYLHDRYKKGIVGVRLERGVDMIVALLGIVLSGNAYMPIGVDYPEERVKYMVENAGAKTVLDRKFMSSFRYDGPRFVADAKGEDICYVIYTSGSTGRPKGAKISHKAIANRLCWMEKRYPLAGGAILQKTPYTFDVSVWDIFRPLLFGGRLVLTPPGLHADPKTIADLVKKYSVTQAHFVPSVYDIYLEYCQANEVAPIKDLFLSGEKLSKKTVEKHNAVFGKKSALHNLYGPTECAVDVTYYDLEGDETDIPIGKPVDNTEISVVSRGKVVPPYVEGEIVIGGANVGSGYIGKTRGGFVGGKYYTGDIGWADKNGDIHFVGRKDRQIKWNGMRIEPGEIEWQIGRIDGVKDAVVAMVGKNPVLCAFIVAEDKEKTDGEIKRRLPEYMLPTRRVYVDKIPLSENGKRDLAALSQVVEEKTSLPRAAKSILDAVEEVVGEKIGFDTPFEEAGIGSLERIRLSVKLAPFGFAFADLVRANSVRELYLREHNEYFMKFAGGNEKAVVCIPYAGGTAHIYKALSPAEYDVYAAVGCTFDEKDWPAVIKEVKRIRAEYKKVVLYAHCLGGMTALKLAKEIAFDLVVFGAHVPDAVSSFFGRPIDAWKHTGDKTILATLKKGGLKKGGTDFAPLFRKDASRAARIEAEKPVVSVPAVLLLAENDPFTSSKKAEKRWKKFLSGEIKIITLAGKDHYFISDKDFGAILLATMEEENG